VQLRFEERNAKTELPENVPLVEEIVSVDKFIGALPGFPATCEALDREEPLCADMLGKAEKLSELAKDEFLKADSEKEYRPELVTIEFRRGMAKILAIGAKKYSADNWRKCKDPKRYIGALMRHVESFETGEKLDPETGEHHLLHAACCLMMLHGIDLMADKERRDESLKHPSKKK
jgi:hypothetical protein